MAQNIKGVSGLIPAFTLWMDYRAGKRDGKNGKLFEQVIANANDPRKCAEAYYTIPWVAKKVDCFNRHCYSLYEKAINQISPVEKELEDYRQQAEELKGQMAEKEENRIDGLVPALKSEIRKIQKKMSKEKEIIEKIDAQLTNWIRESSAELNLHVDSYREGVVRRFNQTVPQFSVPEIGKSNNSPIEHYNTLKNIAISNINFVILKGGCDDALEKKEETDQENSHQK